MLYSSFQSYHGYILYTILINILAKKNDTKLKFDFLISIGKGVHHISMMLLI